MEGTLEDRNKAFVEKVDLAFATGDSGFILAHMHEEVLWEMVGESRFEGKKEVERIIGEMEGKLFPEIIRTRITAEGNYVLAEGLLKFVNKKGISVNAFYCDSYTIEDGKIRELRSYVIEDRQRNA